MVFAQNLRYLREINHTTQEELASYLKVTRSTVAGYETKGKQPDYDKLLKIAAYFHVSVDFLLHGVRQDDQYIPDYIVTKKIGEHEFITAYRKLSKTSRQKHWDYLGLLQMAEQKDQKETKK